MMQRSRVLPFGFLLGAVAAVTLVACGQQDGKSPSQGNVDIGALPDGTGIVGGQPVPETQSDARRWSTVALTTDEKGSSGAIPLDTGRSFCSGTIIGEKVILTAAHCLQKFNASTRRKEPGLIFPKNENFLVYFGTKVSRDGTWLRAKRVIPHPDWDPATTLQPNASKPANDIGIIVLEKPIPQGYKPVKIADEDADLGSRAYLAGYGVTRSRNNNDTGTLRQVETSLQSADKRSWRIGVGSFGRGACAGDSGGPLYVKVGDEFQVAGATSTGAEIFGQCLGLANNYTDARFYTDWVVNTLRGEGLIAAQ